MSNKENSANYAIIVGGNRGIGFFIARGIAKQRPDLDVILTARNEGSGEKAVMEIKKEGIQNITYMLLDIANNDSISTFRNNIVQQLSRIEFLFINSGVSMDFDRVSVQEKIQKTFDVNYYGVKRIFHALSSQLIKNARVIITASYCGKLVQSLLSKEVLAQVRNVYLTEEDIDEFSKQYIKSVEANQHKSVGYSGWVYGVSKLLVIALAEALGKAHASDFSVNSFCPGYVKSDMAGYTLPPKSTQQGADTALYLAMRKEQPPTGVFFTERMEIDWRARLSVVEAGKIGWSYIYHSWKECEF